MAPRTKPVDREAGPSRPPRRAQVLGAVEHDSTRPGDFGFNPPQPVPEQLRQTSFTCGAGTFSSVESATTELRAVGGRSGGSSTTDGGLVAPAMARGSNSAGAPQTVAWSLKVIGSEKARGGFVEYLVEVELGRGLLKSLVRRRYSLFEELHATIMELPCLAAHPLERQQLQVRLSAPTGASAY
eukprot:SAG11_NODE_432_length_9520_cov_102.527863_3_plen_184_part_00